MAKYTVDVACFFCFTPNRVQIGVEFYEQRAFYICHNCGRSVSLHITQTSLLIPGSDNITQRMQKDNIQTGEPI